MTVGVRADAAGAIPVYEIRDGQLAVLLSRLPSFLAANCFIACSIVAVLLMIEWRLAPLAWLAAVFGWNAVRYATLRRIERRPRAAADSDRLLERLARHAFVSGLLWMAPPVFTVGSIAGLSAFVPFIQCGTAAGSVLLSPGHARSALAFAIPCLVATIFCLFIEGTIITSIVAFDIIILSMLMIRTSRRSEAEFLANQTDRLRAEQLAGWLTIANAEIQHSNRQLEVLANRDPLTGLANRAAFNQRLRKLLRSDGGRPGPVALLVADLDRFKSINDTMGHAAGDLLLTEFARRLLGLAAPADFATRLGGDEFALVIDGPDAEERAAAIGNGIMAMMAIPVLVGDRPVTVGASVGLAVSDGEGTSAEELFARADIALYAAKDQGRRRVCVFNPDIRRQLERQKQIELGFAGAIASGAIRADFQPQVDLVTGAVIGFEALARWTHPVLGAVRPQEIAQAAQTVHDSMALTRRMAQSAAVLARDLRARGLRDVPVAINVSPREIASNPVAAMLTEVIREAGVPPSLIEVEITEEALLDSEAAGEELARLDRAGFRLAVDDFGMGHSSLAYLVRLRIDRVKTDRSLVAGLAESPQNQVLLSALLGIGRSLSINVLAEGVEREEDAATLRSLGCRSAQGYHFGRPMTAEAVASWLDARAGAGGPSEAGDRLSPRHGRNGARPAPARPSPMDRRGRSVL